MNVLTQRYKVDVEEVHSGDDLILMVDLGVDNLYKKVRARLLGVDTPDAYKADATTEAGKVRDWVKTLVRGKICYIDLHSSKKGGWIVTLFTKDGDEIVNINDTLKNSGFVFESRRDNHNEPADSA